MHKKYWLLLTIGAYIEPIQVQKTLFKFSQESSAPPPEKYDFQPYNWGPCATAIYSDLDELREAGLIEFVPTGRGWSAYKVSHEGEEVVARLRTTVPDSQLKELDEKRSWVMGRSFRKLLTDVYDEYPDYATRSLFER